MLDVCYYGELDPFSGGLGVSGRDLRRARRELAALLLLHDVVILSPGTFLEHGLTLPLFQSLAPLARAGRLGTTADLEAPSPSAYLAGRAKQLLEEGPPDLFGGPRPSRRSLEERRRRDEVLRACDGWQALLPPRFPLRRSVAGQVRGFGERMDRFAQEAVLDGEAARALARFLAENRDPRHPIDRNDVLAFVAAERGLLLPGALGRIAQAAQAAYFDLGVRIHATGPGDPGDGVRCALFPGEFARLARAQAEKGLPIALPPLAEGTGVARVGARLRALGLDASRLLDGDPQALLALVASPGWLAVRDLVRADGMAPRAERTVRALISETRDLRRAVERVAGELPEIVRRKAHPAAPVFPGPWQLVVQGSLGTLALERINQAGGAQVTLDLRRLRLAGAGREVALSAGSAQLVVLLQVAGDVGLRPDDVVQLGRESGRLGERRGGALAWPAPRDEGRVKLLSRRNVAAVLRNRTDLALRPFGLRIETDRASGRWRLSGGGGAPSIAVRGIIWDLDAGGDVRGDVPAPPAWLSRAQLQLYRAMAEAAPHYVSVHALAGALDKDDDERGRKQTIDELDRLRRRLALARARVQVVRYRRGLYGLALRLPGEIGD